jgi:3-hydroxyisobutyrate dehydrogenase
VLGTGTMGAAMATNIAAAGMGLRVWNRGRDLATPLVKAGAVVCDSPADWSAERRTR